MALTRTRLRPIASAAAGFALYGAWGYLANRGVSEAVARRVALGQGLFSFTVTLSVALLVEAVYARTRRLAATVGLCLGAVYALMLAAHSALGTPRLLLTIAPGALVTAAFVTAYARGVARGQSDQTILTPR